MSKKMLRYLFNYEKKENPILLLRTPSIKVASSVIYQVLICYVKRYVILFILIVTINLIFI